MIDISKWAFENKKLIYFLIAVLIVGGAYSSYEMSKLEDPEVTVKVAVAPEEITKTNLWSPVSSPFR